MLVEALDSRLGGSPFGPAGTGKTESVNALGHALGRFTLVFNCDETFVVNSAVSQQIQSIQETLKLSMYQVWEQGQLDKAKVVSYKLKFILII